MELKQLLARHAGTGRVEWIGIRPARLAPVHVVDSAEIGEGGIAGDHHASGGKRAVTLIQAEHLPLIAGFAGQAGLDPALLRRNVVVSGINLAALRHRDFRLGAARLRITGPCAPCSRMETAIGFGGYNAMRGHGGFYAEVLAPGQVSLGDTAQAVGDD
ncbi:MOSC domain-containing protein [Stappia sp.]|uniref:MOSC domain-containing protein n=1 Tax=Stappia sp. TaxID=1870903 RepID=UPI003A998DA6